MSTEPSTAHLEESTGESESDDESADIEELVGYLGDVHEDAESSTVKREVEEIRELLEVAHERGLIDSGVRRLQKSDAAEAFVGSVIFASPLLIEDGVFDIGEYLFSFTVVGIPIFLLLNTVFVVLMTYALIEWTGRNKEETHLFLGVLPVRVVMTLATSFVVAALLMTVWGRVGDWSSPIEAIARINVLWTVGSLGAALGDIISDSNPEPAPEALDAWDRDEADASSEPTESGEPIESSEPTGRSATAERLDSVEELSDGRLVAAIHERFDGLESTLEDREDRGRVKRIRERTTDATLEDGFGDKIRKYTSRDIAEGFVGSVFFSIPFLVEDGVYDVADYFLSFRVGQFPVFFLLNAAFVLFMVSALVYWAGPQDVQVSRPLFGFLPRRLVGIALVSFLTAAALMTMWGRVGNWQDPVVAVARISVVWTTASFGAAIGDILPGESSGDDINDDLSDLGDRVRELDDAIVGRER